MLYCEVIDGQIVAGPRPLPDFHAGKTPEELVALGWLQAVYTNMPHQLEADPITEFIQMSLAVVGNRVECSHAVVQKSPQEIADTVETHMQMLRAQRTNRLLVCDYTQLPDAPLTEAQRAAWGAYRQALRDFPSVVNLSNVIWPTPPVE